VKGERRLLRAGEFLVGRAVRWLPAKVRDERRREWAAELPAILRDPSGGPGWRRAARMLGYAFDTIRGAALRPGQAPYPGSHRGSDRWTMVMAGPWLLSFAAALGVLLAFLSAPVLLVYLVSWSSGLGLWPATGVSAVILLACCLVPRRILAVSAGCSRSRMTGCAGGASSGRTDAATNWLCRSSAPTLGELVLGCSHI
jgi:hypothetical protein